MEEGKRLAVAAVTAVLFWTVIFWGRETGAGSAVSSASNLSPGEAASLIRENGSRRDFVILDVRTEREYLEERIAGAVLVDYRADVFRENVSRLDRDATYLVYCRTGSRSEGALSVMKGLGFGRTYHLSGGITKWKGEGFPTAK